MFKLNSLPRFEKSLRKLSPDASLKKRIIKTLEKLQDNPQNPGLRTHKVDIKYSDLKVKSSKVSGDLMIFWEYSKKEKEVIDLIDIGGHSRYK